MTEEKKRSGCIGKLAKLVGAVVVVGLVYAIFSGDKSDPGSSAPATKPPPPVQEAASLLPYTVIDRTETERIKVSFDLRIDIVDGRLPNEDELGAISKYLIGQEKNHERSFVVFYLPGMEVGAGAFATAHHNPKMEVKILTFMLPEQYKALITE